MPIYEAPILYLAPAASRITPPTPRVALDGDFLKNKTNFGS